MLAAFYYNNHDIRVQEIPMPKVDEEEVLLKVMASGICGSDVIEWYRIPKAPRVLGHEATGIITQTGDRVKNWQGERVFVSHHVPCFECRHCQRGNHTACHTLHTTNYYPGGFAQYVRVPKINVEYGIYRLPDAMSFEEGTFIEPLACVSRGQRLSGLKNDDTVLIIGSGISGILHVQLAKYRGVKNIIVADINPYRLELAKKFGAQHTLKAEMDLSVKLQEATGHLADQVIVCTGAASAAMTAMGCVENGGTILFFAVPDPTVKLQVPINQFWRNEITMRTSYGAAPNDIKDALQILATGKLDIKEMITHRFPLTEVQEGFRLTAEAGNSLKIILEPNQQ
ncbi:MAG: alcohol dehydrogenase catalytic domain-containing protein [Nitrososphaerota archaeon]|nr:alcohol dehydrogenase catalytic domain-containing protein [Nitrososphaerota archaeon]